MSSASCPRRAAPVAIALAISSFSGATAAGQPPTLPDLPASSLERMDGAGRQLQTVGVSRISEAAELDGPRKLSLVFPNAAPIRDVLLLLMRGTPFSAVVESSVDARFAGELRDLTIRQALEAVLFASGLDYEVRKTVVCVFPSRPRTRMFALDLLSTRRVRAHAAGSAPVASSAETDAMAEIDAGVRALLSQQGRHHIDRRAGLVQVTDFAERLDQIGLYLEAVQLRATRQVRIEARVLQVSLNPGVWGVDVAALAGKEGSGIRGASDAGVAVDDFEALARALSRWGQVTAGGTQRLLALNNETGFLRMATGVRGSSETDVALSVAVTAQISADGVVQMNVRPHYTAGGAIGDIVSTVDADTVARVRAGETLVLSGMHNAPSTTAAGRHIEVLLLLTPTIVGADPQAGER